jgi:hypothetical protein
MRERTLTPEEYQEALSHQTSELIEMGRTLSFWLDGVHYPSEGGYLENVVRSYLRRRIPKQFEISTGFISILDSDTDAAGHKKFTRKVSRQFDILIWDKYNFPPLFQADDFVVVVPESVRTIIEVTKNLTTDKLKKDLEKFDDLHEYYSHQRQQFRPYTAMLAFSSKKNIKNVLQDLEQFYIFRSNIPISYRYAVARAQPLETLPLATAGFLDSICVLDQGLIRGEMVVSNLESPNRVVQYMADTRGRSDELSFGLFERHIVLYLSRIAAQSSRYGEASVDIYRELMDTSSTEAGISLIIEDWDLVMPSLNVQDKMTGSITPKFGNCVTNVSKFVGADFTSDEPNPTMYIEHYGPNIWAFEHHLNNIFACGRYRNGSRVGLWRVSLLSEERQIIYTNFFEISGKDLFEILRKFKEDSLSSDSKEI